MKKILLALLVFSSFLFSDITKSFPPLDGRVVDIYNLLNSDAKNRITTILQNHEKETSNQIVVVILKSLDGYEIADYSYQLGRHWGIGQKDKNNGVLLVISMNDRKLRIEVGYGLEGALTDKISHEIIEYTLKPNFRASAYEVGITKAIEQITQAIKGEYTNTNTNRSSSNNNDTFPILFFAMIFISIVVSNISSKTKKLFLYRVSNSSILSSFSAFFTFVISQGFTQYYLWISLITFIIVFIFNFLTTKKIPKASRSNSHNSYGTSTGGFSSSSGGFSSGGFSGGGGGFGGGGASGGW